MLPKLALCLFCISVCWGYQYNSSDKSLKFFLDDFFVSHLGLQYSSSPAILARSFPCNIMPQEVTKANFLPLLRSILSPSGLQVRRSGSVYFIDTISITPVVEPVKSAIQSKKFRKIII